MPYRTVTALCVAALAAWTLAGPASADKTAEQIRAVRKVVGPSTVVVSFTIERDDGAKADVRALGTVVGEGNVVTLASAAFPSQFALSQFKDFKVIVTKGDDLTEYEAEYLGKDDRAQLAFLKVTDTSAPALPPLGFDETTKVQVGDLLISVANLGEPDGYERVFQMTRVSAQIDQPVTTYLCMKGLGAPGTPVLTPEGKAVGIVGLIRMNRGTNARPKMSLAQVLWPTERFIERIKDPPKGGKAVKQPWLGVQTLTPVTKDLAEYFKLGDRRGVIVGQVIEESPAEKAGIKAEDIILAVGGKPITGTEGQLVENFSNDVRERKVGETLDLQVWRDGKRQTIKVTLAPMPKTAGEAERFRDETFGLTVREMVVGDRISRELPASETGVVVSFLKPAGWAHDGGLRPGDIIKKVQDQDTPTLAEFKKVFRAEVKKKPEEIVVFVLRGKKDTQLVRIEPRW
jgi:serine protease Do